MKNLFLISILVLPIGIFAQSNGNGNQQIQMQNVNYYDQIDINNNDAIQTNLGNFSQQANPPAQVQQQKSSGSIFGSEENNETPKSYCKDCDAVHKALAAAHASSASGTHHRKTSGFKKWCEKFSYNTSLKMKKMFARKYRAKTSYEICFNWK
ncbi:MAG: hypothetical protein HY063_06945 [Bacteroidetes bacterium]|nr:hypothetical protein [Bacteroidota bacterium]